MYKVGDEVLIKAEIMDIHEGLENPYFVQADNRFINWVSEDKIIPIDKTYLDGLSDAWELARKVVGMGNDNRDSIFGYPTVPRVIETHTAEEAFAKIEAYEKEKEIKVGDVVSFEDETKALVVDEALEKAVFVFTENGCVEKWDRTLLKKTGKHIDIESLLRQIGE